MTTAAYTVAERKHWTKPGHSSVAAHCIPQGEGWTLSVSGYRVVRPDGVTVYRPSVPPHATRAAAQAEADALNLADTVDTAAEAALDAMASSLADSMGWTSGDFMPCQLDALRAMLKPAAVQMAKVAADNGLLPGADA